MNPFFENYMANLLELHDEIREAITSLPLQALDWKPNPDMNSLTVLVVHITGAERYWIGDVIAGIPSGRDRDAEFEKHGCSADELIHLLDNNDHFISKVLGTYELQELDKRRVSPRNDRGVSAGWALLHVLKHTALHTGHIEIIRQAWEQQKASTD